MSQNNDLWQPFQPTSTDLDRIAREVSEIPDIQQKTCTTNGDLRFPERVAHEYQIAGSNVTLKVARTLPDRLNGIGLFQPGEEYFGVGRISTGLGIPHSESLPDFLGIMVAFQTKEGRRVDFLGINNPTSPADDHRDFMDILHATGESAGAELALTGQTFIAQQAVFSASLVRRMGLVKAGATVAHLTRQTVLTAHSSTAAQRYWTGVVQVGGIGGKFTFVPVIDQNQSPGLFPGATHLTEEWKSRQAAGSIEFTLYWIPFLNEEKTPTQRLTYQWEEDHKQIVGTIAFPQADPDPEQTQLWSILASEMGANPGNWIADAENAITEPTTEFGIARMIAYRKSQEGRNVLPEDLYRSVFLGSPIGPKLADELRKRRRQKVDAGHVNQRS